MGLSCPFGTADRHDAYDVELPEGDVPAGGLRRRARRPARHVAYTARKYEAEEVRSDLLPITVAVTKYTPGSDIAIFGCVVLVDATEAEAAEVQQAYPNLSVEGVAGQHVVACLQRKRAEQGFRYAVCSDNLRGEAVQGLSWMARRPRACPIVHEPQSETMWVRLSVLDSAVVSRRSGAMSVQDAIPEACGCPPFKLAFG